MKRSILDSDPMMYENDFTICLYLTGLAPENQYDVDSQHQNNKSNLCRRNKGGPLVSCRQVAGSQLIPKKSGGLEGLFVVV